jgi:Leucine-rich repeat (LRR) protein
MIPDLFQYEIIPFIDISLYKKLLLVNKEFYHYCLNGTSNVIVKINPFSRIGGVIEYTNITNQNLTKLGKINGFIKLDLIHAKVSAANDCLKYIPNLKILHLGHKSHITGDGFKYAANLKSLHLDYTYNLRNNEFRHMPNIQLLYIDDDSSITDNDIKNLPNLKMLLISNNEVIMGKCLEFLPKLELLGLFQHSMIRDHDLKHVSNLKVLWLDNENITDEGLKNLHNLEVLYIDHASITHKGIANLPNLKILHLDLCPDVIEENDIDVQGYINSYKFKGKIIFEQIKFWDEIEILEKEYICKNKEFIQVYRSLKNKLYSEYL